VACDFPTIYCGGSNEYCSAAVLSLLFNEVGASADSLTRRLDLTWSRYPHGDPPTPMCEHPGHKFAVRCHRLLTGLGLGGGSGNRTNVEPFYGSMAVYVNSFTLDRECRYIVLCGFILLYVSILFVYSCACVLCPSSRATSVFTI
jgi:hypothetical protein